MNLAPRHFEYVRGTSRKFWEIQLRGTLVITRWGRIGSIGNVTKTPCSGQFEAKQVYTKLIQSKLRKGYNEGTGIPF